MYWVRYCKYQQTGHVEDRLPSRRLTGSQVGGWKKTNKTNRFESQGRIKSPEILVCSSTLGRMLKQLSSQKREKDLARKKARRARIKAEAAERGLDGCTRCGRFREASSASSSTSGMAGACVCRKTSSPMACWIRRDLHLPVVQSNAFLSITCISSSSSAHIQPVFGASTLTTYSDPGLCVDLDIGSRLNQHNIFIPDSDPDDLVNADSERDAIDLRGTVTSMKIVSQDDDNSDLSDEY